MKNLKSIEYKDNIISFIKKDSRDSGVIGKIVMTYVNGTWIFTGKNKWQSEKFAKKWIDKNPDLRNYEYFK